MSITITPLTGAVGALVEGADLNQPIAPEEFAVLHEALITRGVLVWRGQHLKPDAHIAFAKLWGTPAQNNPLDPSVPGYPGLIQVTKIPKETASTEAWHSDSAYTKVPPKISILSAVVVPHGGDTMWCNQYVSYERLSPTMQAMLEGLCVRFAGLRLARMRGIEEVPEAVHPMVRTHPETKRKALYVGHHETAQKIEGMTVAESRPLLDFLYHHSTQPDNIYRHMWQVGDVVIWDNRCTMHYAVHDYGEADRCLNRITVAGEVPV